MISTERVVQDWPSRWSRRQLSGDVWSLVTEHPMVAGAAAMFAVLAIVYTFSISIRATTGASITADEPFYLLTTQSIIQDQDLDLNNQYAAHSYEEFFDHPDGLWKQSVPSEDGRLLSPHNPGLSLLVVPGYLAGQLRGVQVQLLLITALTFAMTYVLVARITGRIALSWLAALAIGITPTAFVYSTEIYPEIPAALTLVLSLLIVTRRSRPSTWDAVMLAGLLSAMMWLGVKYAPLGALVALPLLVRASWRPRLVFVALASVSGIYFAWFHLVNFDGLTPYAVNIIYAGGTSVEIVQQHVSFVDRFYRTWGLFIDERFGLARWGFIIFPAVAGLVLLPWKGWQYRLVLALVVTQVLIATFVAITMMGWWFPGRTLATVLPLLAVPLVLLLDRASVPLRWLVGLLGLQTVAVTAALVQAGHAREIRLAVNPFEMSSPLFQGVSWLFPNYTSWDAHTTLTTVVWLLVAGSIAALLTAKQYRQKTATGQPAHRS